MTDSWSRAEVAATVADYLDMLEAELSGVRYNKTAHRQRLLPRLNGRSAQAVEYKHANISAALIDLGFPFIAGYKRRSNYQGALLEEVSEQLATRERLLEIAADSADRRVTVPEVDDILAVLTERPKGRTRQPRVAEAPVRRPPFSVNYLEREARNRSLGEAGERFVINYECARLIQAGREPLAARIEHVARTRGDGAGYDVLSFESSGAPRLIEVKTTKYGQDTPFFLSRNEVDVSAEAQGQYHLYRLFDFAAAPRLFILEGQLSGTCHLSASTFIATAA
ncbi:hypothetical protein KBTX_02135 [wastewater metagenome]|uniref:Protein NO VEIN C-terminal domain-containing protein n=3 Tax=root TaxID=1 RepID=A0A5B8RAL2_9ZZZZ|nr:DUF3883 domain-containing protein [Arhodomonas aquaeolei]QEA05810.1 hypothetical protein KBTEX_02135 [uncultured organism]